MAVDPRSDALSLWRSLESEYERYNALVRQLPLGLLRVQDDFRRYLCLRCAGFLEQVTFVALQGFIDQNSYGAVGEFAKARFAKSPNLNVDAFTKLMHQLGGEYGPKFDDFLNGVRRESLGDLMSIRNDVAHGRLSSGSRLDPDRYITLCSEVHDWLIDVLFAGTVVELGPDGKQVVGVLTANG